MKFNFYSDPGHGWVRVPIKLVKELGIKKEITSYSYVREPYFYLEEDQDATLFISAMKKAGKEVTFKEFHTNKSSRIRNYEHLLP